MLRSFQLGVVVLWVLAVQDLGVHFSVYGFCFPYLENPQKYGAPFNDAMVFEQPICDSMLSDFGHKSRKTSYALLEITLI